MFSQPLLVAQLVKNLPAVQETWLQSLGWEDLLEKDTATHCSILAWKIPWTEEPGRFWAQDLKVRSLEVHLAPALSVWQSCSISLYLLSGTLWVSRSSQCNEGKIKGCGLG